MAKLEWPELMIDNGGGWKNYTWLLVRGIVQARKDSEEVRGKRVPRSSLDLSEQNQLYAFEVEEKVKKEKIVFFASKSGGAGAGAGAGGERGGGGERWPAMCKRGRRGRREVHTRKGNDD